MSILRRRTSLRPPLVVLGLAVMGLAVAPGASAAAPPLDTVSVTGSGGLFSGINITGQSGTSGQNPSGSVSFIFAGAINVSGPVTCLSVTGPDHGGGTSSAPTTAILKFQATTFTNKIDTLEVVDNGGNGADTIGVVEVGRAATDCSSPSLGFESSTLTGGRAVVFDAAPVPTSKDQCKDGGWRNFPQFKNQGDCVSFVENGK